MSILTAKLVKAAEPDYKDTPIPQQLGTVKSDLVKDSVNLNPYKDSNEKLYSIVGKTQLIKFDEPVKRISITDPSLADLVLLSPKELMLTAKKAEEQVLYFGATTTNLFSLIL